MEIKVHTKPIMRLVLNHQPFSRTDFIDLPPRPAAQIGKHTHSNCVWKKWLEWGAHDGRGAARASCQLQECRAHSWVKATRYLPFLSHCCSSMPVHAITKCVSVWSLPRTTVTPFCSAAPRGEKSLPGEGWQWWCLRKNDRFTVNGTV